MDIQIVWDAYKVVVRGDLIKLNSKGKKIKEAKLSRNSRKNSSERKRTEQLCQEKHSKTTNKD